MELLERILDDKNLFNAYKQVYKNKGASGVDNVMVDDIFFTQMIQLHDAPVLGSKWVQNNLLGFVA